jgi:type I restriction enzyme, R subunit
MVDISFARQAAWILVLLPSFIIFRADSALAHGASWSWRSTKRVLNEADTCRKFVVPKLQGAGWETEPHSIAEQRTITDGRIVPIGKGFVRKPPKRADYILRYERNFPLAVVEAKANWKTAGEGIQQARDYAELLQLNFAYATNGQEIIEFDYFTGKERIISSYPTPAELWCRYSAGKNISVEAGRQILTPMNHLTGKGERYYQEIAINRAVEGILTRKRRQLLTMATGTGKTAVAFQICWKLWNARWNRNLSSKSGSDRKPKILFLADRNILIDDPMAKDFAAFGDARWKLEGGVVNKGREMYFAIYQALARDERRPGLYKEFPPDFFDLIIVDECHRGSARDDSSWREILEYFEPAYQLGMTATPLREENRDTYLYFGNPIYTYSLRQGIDDGFLAPYRVHRIISDWDAAGWRPSKETLDRYGRAIPDEEYQTKDFERVVALRARTQAIARHLTDFLKKTDRFAKTVVFCVDQEHAHEMRRALNNLNADLIGHPRPSDGSGPGGEGSSSDGSTHSSPSPPLEERAGERRPSSPAGGYPDYVCRVTSDEGSIGRGHLSRFQDVESHTPVILTTSQMLTTGVDMPTCKNVVLARVVGSMSEFKQIIGRGTRVRDEYGKLWFNILDYTGSATRLFADPTFDGDPARLTQEEIDEAGEVKETDVITPDEPEDDTGEMQDKPRDNVLVDGPIEERCKFYFDGGQVEIAAHLVYELDPDGKQLRCVRYTEFAAEKVRSLCPSTPELRARWADPEQRAELIRKLAERGINFEHLAEQAQQADADPFDLLCHLAYNAPLRTRRERAQRLRSERKDFFEQHAPEARQILDELLEKYAEHGAAQFLLPDVLKVPPVSDHGQIGDIIKMFGGPEKLRGAVNQLQTLLYAA